MFEKISVDDRGKNASERIFDSRERFSRDQPDDCFFNVHASDWAGIRIFQGEIIITSQAGRNFLAVKTAKYLAVA